MAHTRIWKVRDLSSEIRLSRSTIYARVKAGTFPRPIKLGGSRASGWLAEDIEAWLLSCIQASDAKRGAQ
jgi:prophage regulatory protein